jgi:hypothetical protein
MPNVKCIAWEFDGLNFVGFNHRKEILKYLTFEDGDFVPDVEKYFYLHD